MDPNIIKRNVVYISNGTESDSRIFQSMMEKAQIDVNSTYAKNVMFTTPKSFEANTDDDMKETFVSRYHKQIDLGVGIITVAGLLLLVFGATRFLQGKTR